MTPPIDPKAPWSLPLADPTPGSLLRNSPGRPACVCRLGLSLNAPRTRDFRTSYGLFRTPAEPY